MKRLLCALRAISFLCLYLLPGLALPLHSQSTVSTVSGAVLDPSGAAIPNAKLHLHSAAIDRTSGTDALGRFTIALPQGKYDLSVEATGFRAYSRSALAVPTAHDAALNVTLQIDTASEEVNVPLEPTISTDADANKSALVFKSEQLDTLSDDPNTLQQQLLALGGSDPSSPVQIYVDGFSNGTMPPKDSIREIRINQNPFSAVYDQFGSGRIEIFTKPGATQIHGSAETNIGTDALDASNPYAPAHLGYLNHYSDGDLNGPLGKNSSFYLSAQRSDLSQNAIINATTLASSLNPLPISENVGNRSTSQTYSGRLDHQFGKNNTLIGRYIYSLNSQPNAGLGQFVLPTQAYATGSRSQTLRLSDTHLFGANVVLDSGFQYIRTRTRQDAVSSLPSVVVQGSFSTGGNPAQSLHDNQDRIELQEYLSIAHKTHFFRTGVRYRMLRDANLATAGYNGQFIFPSLTAFQITQQVLRANPNAPDAQVRATCVTGTNGQQVCGGATQFSLSAGQPSASLLTGDAGMYFDDEWKLTPKLTLNYGIRFESQSTIPDHLDVAPRLGFAYAVQPGKAKEPIVVVRGGFGLFYQRFDSGDILTSLRENGASEQVYFQTNPAYTCEAAGTVPCVIPNVPSVASLSAGPSTVYRINPNLHAPMQMQGMVAIEHSFGKYGNIGATYNQRRTVHAYESLNLNAPMPGTGVRPLGGTQNVYEYSSDGISNGRNFWINGELNLTKRLSAWASVNAGHQTSDTSGADSFVSNSYNVGADAGPYTGFSPRRLYSGINAQPGWDTSISMFFCVRSSPYFNITTGQDNNGDSIYNDRPAFATDLSRASVVRTAYGNFDTNPLPNQTIIPFDYGHAPAFLYLEMYANKNFRFGPRPATPAPATTHDAAQTGKKAELPPQRYRLVVGIGADNLLNNVNPAPPVGVLSSPYFGQSISLYAPFTNNTAANRTVTLRGAFYF